MRRADVVASQINAAQMSLEIEHRENELVPRLIPCKMVLAQHASQTYMPAQKLTPDIINAAIDGFESQRRRIDSQIAELRQLLNGDRTSAASGVNNSAHKRKVSAAARRRMAAAQKARWAKVRVASAPTASATAAKPAKRERKLSAAGRKAISEAAKKRWALKPAGARKS